MDSSKKPTFATKEIIPPLMGQPKQKDRLNQSFSSKSSTSGTYHAPGQQYHNQQNSHNNKDSSKHAPSGAPLGQNKNEKINDLFIFNGITKVTLQEKKPTVNASTAPNVIKKKEILSIPKLIVKKDTKKQDDLMVAPAKYKKPVYIPNFEKKKVRRKSSVEEHEEEEEQQPQPAPKPETQPVELNKEEAVLSILKTFEQNGTHNLNTNRNFEDETRLRNDFLHDFAFLEQHIASQQEQTLLLNSRNIDHIVVSKVKELTEKEYGNLCWRAYIYIVSLENTVFDKDTLDNISEDLREGQADIGSFRAIVNTLTSENRAMLKVFVNHLARVAEFKNEDFSRSVSAAFGEVLFSYPKSPVSSKELMITILLEDVVMNTKAMILHQLMAHRDSLFSCVGLTGSPFGENNTNQAEEESNEQKS